MLDSPVSGVILDNLDRLYVHTDYEFLLALDELLDLLLDLLNSLFIRGNDGVVANDYEEGLVHGANCSSQHDALDGDCLFNDLGVLLLE